MSFQDRLNQEANKLEENRGGGDFDKVTHPTSTLKHDMLYLSKDRPEYLVRILPPKDVETFFGVGFQRMFFDVTNASGKRINSPMIMPLQADPENNLLDQKVQEWVQNKTMPGQYPETKPQTRYYINVVQLQQLGGGQYQHELTPDGKPMIRVMEVPLTAYRGIINELSDTNIPAPEGSVNYGPIDSANAYPFKISRTGARLDTEYHVRMYVNPLGPLPQGWEDELPDLNYIATPSETYNEEFVQYMIAVHEGQEQAFNAERSQGGDGSTGGTTTPPQQNQGGFNQPHQGGFNQQQAPQPQQGGFNQQQAPQQNQGFNQPQQGGFNQQQAPQQNQGFNQPVTDADMGHLPPKDTVQPPQQAPQGQPQQGGFNQPEQNTQPAPQQQVNNQPDTSGLPNMDDLIKQVQQDANS